MALTSSAPGASAATSRGPSIEPRATDGKWSLIGIFGQEPVASEFSQYELIVRNGVIASLQAARPGPGAGMENGARLALVPLLVNAHDHGRGWGNVLAGIADAPLETWIASLRGGGAATTQDALVGNGCRAMLASGVGATVICVNPQGPDVAAEVLAAAHAASTSGARAAVVYPFADLIGDLQGRSRDAVGWSTAEVDHHLEAVEAIAAATRNPLLEVQLGPVGPQWVSEGTLRAVGQHARRTGRRVHMHLLESRVQRTWADNTYPDGLVSFLRGVGLAGPHMCFAHGTHLRPDEISALSADGCVLALNASSNLRLASGIPPVAEAHSSPIDLGAGLDGLSLGDDADYWNELRLLRGIAQAQAGQTVPAGPFVDRLLQGGRQALGNCAPKVNTVGNIADFVLVDLGGYEHLLRRGDWAVADVVLAIGSPGRVREVWVGGRAVFSPAGPMRSSYPGQVPSGQVLS
jgi:cytosine/adenosine deaminase-related metal-dependent hydrolase